MDYINQALEGLSSTMGTKLPGIVGAIVVLIIGWIIAKAISGAIRKVLKGTDLDNRLFKGAPGSTSIEKLIAKIVYYVIMLIVLLIVLDMLGVQQVLDPLKAMVDQFLSAVPSLIKAGIIGFAGYMIANIVSEIAGAAGGGLQNFSSRMGLSPDMDISGLLKKIVFVIIFVPILILAIDELGMDAISGPLKGMLNTMMSAIPKLITAAVILGVFYYGGKFVTGILKDILNNLGINDMGQKMGIAKITGNSNLASLAANLVFAFLMFTGVISAVEILEFGQLSNVLSNLLDMSGGIIFGLVILAVGNWISTLATGAVSDSALKPIVRIATMALFLAIALRTMGIANDIVNLAFGLTLGAVAVAVALSFGLGGREAAGKQMEHILSKFRK